MNNLVFNLLYFVLFVLCYDTVKTYNTKKNFEIETAKQMYFHIRHSIMFVSIFLNPTVNKNCSYFVAILRPRRYCERLSFFNIRIKLYNDVD